MANVKYGDSGQSWIRSTDDRMERNEYLSEIQKRFGNDWGKGRRFELPEHDVFFIPEIKMWSYIDGVRAYIYLYQHPPGRQCSLDTVYELSNRGRDHSERFRGGTKWFRTFATMTVIAVISDSGFSNAAEEFVKKTKLMKVAELCFPVLIDLSAERITILEKFGFIGRLPVKKQAKGLKKFFTLWRTRQ